MKSADQMEAIRALHAAIEANQNGFPATSDALFRLAFDAIEDRGARMRTFARERTFSPLTLPPTSDC